jgi:16S rRNA (adenine1518-N6/adenine1519-N6)-dimethyltransferase
VTTKEPLLTTSALQTEAKSFHLKKNLGQHFLVDVEILEQIAGALDICPGDEIIEIGPGIGFLTRLLTSKSAHVTGIDLDRESIAYLENLHLANLTLKHGDILHFDLNKLEFYKKREQSPEPDGSKTGTTLKIAGNVPYQITGRILGHLLGEIGSPSPWLHRLEQVVLLIQWEVAQRLLAPPGGENYSKASLLMNYFCAVELIGKVPAASFMPPPQVTSAIVRLTPFAAPPVDCVDHVFLRQLIEAGFRQRRKMLRNSLGFVRLQPSEIETIFKKLGFDPQARAERLSLQQFAILANALAPLSKANANLRAGASETESNV